MMMIDDAAADDDDFLWQSIPLIHGSHTEAVSVCTYGSAASLLEQLQRVAPETVLLVSKLEEVILIVSVVCGSWSCCLTLRSVILFIIVAF